MNRRDLIKLSPAALITLQGCSPADPDPPQPTPLTKPNTSYRQPTYGSAKLRNPNMNLPSNFGRSGTVSHSRGLSTSPYISLTFDDGPHPTNTPRLLDILRARNVKATFYVIGRNVDRYPHIVRRIVAEGHEIGNHTYTHRKLTSLSASAVHGEMKKTQDAIARAAGVKPRTMRPPYGALLQSQRVEIFNNFGYPTVLWNVDPQDWRRPGIGVVTSRILSQTSNGSIVLVHDLHAPSVSAMPSTVDGLLKKGLQFVTVSQLLAQKALA